MDNTTNIGRLVHTGKQNDDANEILGCREIVIHGVPEVSPLVFTNRGGKPEVQLRLRCTTTGTDGKQKREVIGWEDIEDDIQNGYLTEDAA